MHALWTETLELKTTTVSIVVFLLNVKARAAETERDLKNAQETIAVSGSREKTLEVKVSSLTEELSSVGVVPANLRADLDEMTTLVQQMKEDVGKSL